MGGVEIYPEGIPSEHESLFRMVSSREEPEWKRTNRSVECLPMADGTGDQARKPRVD